MDLSEAFARECRPRLSDSRGIPATRASAAMNAFPTPSPSGATANVSRYTVAAMAAPRRLEYSLLTTYRLSRICPVFVSIAASPDHSEMRFGAAPTNTDATAA